MSSFNGIQKQYPLLHADEKKLANLKQKRYNLAWKEAKKAGALLKSEFKAHRTIIFGSLTDPECFDENSDIDLAVSGIPDKKFYAAVGAVTGIVKEFTIDLVDMNDCKDYLKEAIREEGIEI